MLFAAVERWEGPALDIFSSLGSWGVSRISVCGRWIMRRIMDSFSDEQSTSTIKIPPPKE
jgi:hypothetical protein